MANSRQAFVSFWTVAGEWTAGVPAVLAEESKKLPFQRLDGPTQARVLAALTALIILMFGVMLLAWLGARWARRYANQRPILFEDRQQRKAWSEDDWASRPLTPDEETEEDERP